LQKKTAILSRVLTNWRRFPLVGDVRQAGFMAGIELVQDKSTGRPFPASWKVGQQVCRAARDRGVWIRPLGDVLVILPPLGISFKDLRRLLSVIETALTRTEIRPR
jgi:adenosylmethionine-8-amino-7-oxononanoate aminotransferase